MRQITTTIRIRKFAEDRRDSRRISWQTRTLAKFIAAIGQFEGENPLMAHTDAIALDEDELYELTEADLPENPKSIREAAANGTSSAAVTNRPGSFERLTAGFQPVEGLDTYEFVEGNG